MNKQDAIRTACEIVALAYRSIGDYSHASDGFCDICEAHQGPIWSYANEGHALKYVREAVLDALISDGYTIDEQFDKDTGEAVTPREEQEKNANWRKS